MPRSSYSSIEEIRAELAWVNETPDPKKCGSSVIASKPANGYHFKTGQRG
jgi:hypothetical protein